MASHGAATAHDFAWWSGLSVEAAREALAAAERYGGCARQPVELRL